MSNFSELWMPEPISRESRRELGLAVAELVRNWRVSSGECRELLRFCSAAGWREGEPLPADPHVLERAGYLLAIDRALVLLYPYQQHSRHVWLRGPNTRLGGHTPIALMARSLVGVRWVHDVIDSEARPTLH